MTTMTTGTTDYPRLRYRILTHAVEIDVPDAAMRDAVARVLGHFTPDDGDADDGGMATERVQYTLVRSSEQRWMVSRSGSGFGTDTEMTSGLLALEWHLVTDALAKQTTFFHLHGAALATPGGQRSVLVVGESGSGKTTLMLALMQRGFLPYSDDVALIEPESLLLHPFPRAFHLREGTRALLRERPDAPLGDFARLPPGFLLPPRYASAPAPVRFVVFPSLRLGQPPEFVPLTPAESATMLLSQTLTLTGTPVLALGTAARLTVAARCGRLFMGDLAATADLVAALTTEGPAPSPAP